MDNFIFTIFVYPFIIWTIFTLFSKNKKRIILMGPLLSISFLFLCIYLLSLVDLSKHEAEFVVKYIYVFKVISHSIILGIFAVIQYFFRRKINANKFLSSEIERKKKEELGYYNFNTTVGKVEVSNPYRGTLVVGGAGSGKSKTFIYPIIQQSAKMNFTGVLYDFKSPELINFTKYQYQKHSNVKINIVDFKDINNSSRVNPLDYVNNSTEANNYAQALIYNLLPEYIQKQDFWSRSVLTLFSGTIWYFRKNKPEFATLPHIFAFLISAKAIEIITILTEDREIKGFLSSLAEAVEQKAEKQIAGILGTLKNAIGVYNTSDIFWILSKSEVNLDVNNPNNPTMLLVGNNSKLSESYAPLISMIITVCSKLMNEPNKEKSSIIIDEAPTLYLPNFEQIPATARSNKVSVVVGTQDIAQMVDKYGKEKADVLISNLGNQFYGRTTNKETAERVVKLFGQKEDIEMMKSSSGQGCMAIFLGFHSGRSKNQTIVKRDRVKIQEITNFKPGQFTAMISEGNMTEFVGQFDSIEENIIEDKESVKPSVSKEEMEANFNVIYNDIEKFISSHKQSFGFD